jgi:hypothetical protein
MAETASSPGFDPAAVIEAAAESILITTADLDARS